MVTYRPWGGTAHHHVDVPNGFADIFSGQVLDGQGHVDGAGQRRQAGKIALHLRQPSLDFGSGSVFPVTWFEDGHAHLTASACDVADGRVGERSIAGGNSRDVE